MSMKPKDVCIYSGPVAGIAYAEANWRLLVRGETVSFSWERSNTFDKNAIKITCSIGGVNRKIGYVPKNHTKVFHMAHNQGFRIKGRVDSVKREEATVFVEAFVKVSDQGSETGPCDNYLEDVFNDSRCVYCGMLERNHPTSFSVGDEDDDEENSLPPDDDVIPLDRTEKISAANPVPDEEEI